MGSGRGDNGICFLLVSVHLLQPRRSLWLGVMSEAGWSLAVYMIKNKGQFGYSCTISTVAGIFMCQRDKCADMCIFIRVHSSAVFNRGNVHAHKKYATKSSYVSYSIYGSGCPSAQ